MVNYFKNCDKFTESDISFWAVSSMPNNETGKVEIVATPFNKLNRPIESERIKGIYIKNPFSTETDKVVMLDDKNTPIIFTNKLEGIE